MMQTSKEYVEFKDVDKFWNNFTEELQHIFAEFLRDSVLFDAGSEWKQYTFTHENISVSFWAKRSVLEVPEYETEIYKRYCTIYDPPEVKVAENLESRGVQPDRWRGKKKGKERKCWQR